MANRKPTYDDLFTPEGAVCAGAEATRALGREVGAGLRVGSVVSLEGPLGAGKTQMVKGIAEALGCSEAASSPSFALLHEYDGEYALFHFDFYRMEDAEELLTAGYDDCLADGVTVAEWGDKFPEVLPAGTLRLRFEIAGPDERRIRGEFT